MISESDVESALRPTALQRIEKRSVASDELSPEELLREVHRLLTHVVTILNAPIFEKDARAALSFRLARAHALTLLDHLARMNSP
jgi:hypothetical protein